MIKRGRLHDPAAFACMARHRSFTRAAAELGLSTSNLSHIVSKPGQRLGIRLLQRNSRSVAASGAGEELLTVLGPAQELDVRVPGPFILSEPELMLKCALKGAGAPDILENDPAPHPASGSLVRMFDEWTPPLGELSSAIPDV